ncbi:MAG: type II secretion system protein [Campylobacterota bacterium]|nr:type II secretion system protein [Campylobacterota bacterium]
MRRGFTLIEMIFVVVISSALALGSFKALQALFLRSAKAKAITDMTLRSQIVLDQLGVMLYNRIPNSVIGYTPGGSCEAITELTQSHPILEWMGTMEDELLLRQYDGYINMGDSNKTTKILSAPNISASLNSSDVNLIFSGSLDAGSDETYSACNNAFGWHANASNLSYDVTITNNQIEITDATQPQFIYEKYYLTNTAYAVARGKELKNEAGCTSFNNYNTSLLQNRGKDTTDTTLFLLYNYQPFNGETFCDGNISVLAENVNAFRAEYVNNTLRLSIDMNQTIVNSMVRISKEKVVF